MAEKRFEKVYEEKTLTDEVIIIVDKATGVNYFCYNGGLGLGVSPMYKGDNKLLVSPSMVSNKFKSQIEE